MSTKSKFPETQELFDSLREQKAELEAIVGPLRERYDELQQKMHPYVVEQRAIGLQIRAHMPRMMELDNQIGALARAMGARTVGGQA